MQVVNAKGDWFPGSEDHVVCIQAKGATGNWPGKFNTPPMLLKWNDMTGSGNLGSKFGDSEQNAKFRAVLEMGTGGLLDSEFAEVTEEAQMKFSENLKCLSDNVFTMMLQHPKMLQDKTRKFIAMHAKAQGKDPKEMDLESLADDWAMECLSTPVKWSQNPIQISIDAKAFKKDYKSGSDKLQLKPIPIYDRKGKRLNDNDENTCDISNGSLVKVCFKYGTYVTPTGAFGTKAELDSLTILKVGSGGAATSGEYAECDAVFD